MNSALLQNQMSFKEHEGFHPMIDELVIYVNEWRTTNQLDDSVSLEQARILGEFGASYEI